MNYKKTNYVVEIRITKRKWRAFGNGSHKTRKEARESCEVMRKGWPENRYRSVKVVSNITEVRTVLK